MKLQVGKVYLDNFAREVYIYAYSESDKVYYGVIIATNEDRLYDENGQSNSIFSQLLEETKLKLDIQAGKTFVDCNNTHYYIVGKSKHSGKWIAESIPHGRLYHFDSNGYSARKIDLLKELTPKEQA
jgi:hypothetical protein